MVLASLRAPGSGVYVIQDVCQSDGPLDFDTLRAAWPAIAARHEALRTSIETDAEGQFTRTVHPSPEVSWQRSAAPLAAFLPADSQRGFEFRGAVPMRFHLLDGGRTLVWTVHHALLDGRSLEIVWRELFAVYDGLRAGVRISLPPVAPFAPPAEDRAAPPAPADHPAFLVDRCYRHDPSTQPSAHRRAEFSAPDTQALAAFAAAHGVTMHTLVQAAWALLLSRYSGCSEVVFGVTRNGRTPAAAAAVGLLIETVPLRVALDPQSSVRGFLREIRRHWLALRACAAPPALFDSILVYDRQPVEESMRNLGGTWLTRRLRRIQRTGEPLTLVAYGSPCLTLDLHYDTLLYSEATIARAAQHLQHLLRELARDPARPVGEVEMIPSAEHRWLIQELNRTAAPYPEPLCVHRLIEAQARLRPDHTALEDRGVTISFTGLNRRANRLARLFQAQGLRAHDLVVIRMEPAPDAVVAILAVLKAGAAFLPISPDAPEARVSRMLEDARPKLVIDGPAFAALALACSDLDSADLPGIPAPDDMAYAIFTSGSTGRPKVVAVSHRALACNMVAARRAFDLSPHDRRLQFASPSADAYVAEICNFLAAGSTIVFGLERANRSIAAFLRFVDQHRITITAMPASWWSEWVASMAAGDGALPATLRLLVVGMERMSPAMLRQWKHLVGERVRLFNVYGPSEAAPIATVYETGASPWESESCVPIGMPIDNVRAYVLDSRRRPVPIGVPGELYIGGAGVGLGYLHAAALTAERFLPDPFHLESAARMYASGDLVYRLPDGNLVFLGRADRQAKIRGFRVDLEEIEERLALYPGIRQCAVALAGDPGEEKLIAYLVSAAEPPAASSLRQFLARHLPGHMIPAAFGLVSRLPRAATGKIDRQVLAACDVQWLAALPDYQEPATPMERRIAALWCEILHIARAGAATSFFDLGGDSLRATRLIARLRSDFGQELPLQTLLRAPTIAQMARVLEDGADAAALPAVLAQAPDGVRLPLFCITSSAVDLQVFRQISRHLADEQPFYVMSPPVRDAEPQQTVEELARRVCRSIRETRPHGPYLLGGYCFGGVLAFEAARQLAAASEEVKLLALFDTPTPGYPKLLRRRRQYWRHLVSGAAVGAREVAEHARVVGRLIRRRISAGARRALLSAGLEQSAVHQNEIAARMYVPKSVAVPVVHFIAGDDAVSTRVLEDPRLGWRDFCTGEFRICRVGGSHSTLLLDAHSGRTAALLGAILRELDASPSAASHAAAENIFQPASTTYRR